MGIYRTNDPTQFDDIDGIIIDEQSPPPSITGVSANVAILVGDFQRGPLDLSLPMGSLGELHEIYGNDIARGGNKQLVNKAFGRLRIIRAAASAAAKATLDLDGVLTCNAKYVGAYGNSITVEIEAGSEAVGSKYTIRDTSAKAVLPVEVYDQVVVGDIVAGTFAASKLVDMVIVSLATEPTPQAATALASGSDGTLADVDYEAAIAKAEEEKSGNVLFLDEYNATRNGYLKTHSAAQQDKMVIMCDVAGADKAAAIVSAGLNKDSDGRNIFAWPYVQTTINGAKSLQILLHGLLLSTHKLAHT